MMGKRECPTCLVLRAQVAQLDSLLGEEKRRHDAELERERARYDAELAELRTERRSLTDRLTALVSPHLVGLQGQAPKPVPPPFAADPESGATMTVGGQEVPISRFLNDGTAMVKMLDPDTGEVNEMPLHEWRRLNRLVNEAADGRSPGED